MKPHPELKREYKSDDGKVVFIPVGDFIYL